jgi:serine/threonine protein kinase
VKANETAQQLKIRLWLQALKRYAAGHMPYTEVPLTRAIRLSPRTLAGQLSNFVEGISYEIIVRSPRDPNRCGSTIAAIPRTRADDSHAKTPMTFHSTWGPQRKNLLGKELVVDCALQIAAGMRHMHSRQVAHRDLKPDNILLDRKPGGGWTYKIADFGSAQDVRNKVQMRRHVTTSG